MTEQGDLKVGATVIIWRAADVRLNGQFAIILEVMSLMRPVGNPMLRVRITSDGRLKGLEPEIGARQVEIPGGNPAAGAPTHRSSANTSRRVAR